jgi:hypothetical protein
MPQDHYLPQFYQKRWAVKGKQLFVYQRPNDRVVVARKPPRATGWKDDLYTTHGVPAERTTELEDTFWRLIDQWGSNSLTILESSDPEQATNLDRARWVTFMMSLVFRNPQQVDRINKAAESHYATGFAGFASRYDELRQAHEPDTYDEFMALFQKPGISELGGKILRAFTLNRPIREYLANMAWYVVIDSPIPLLTSDNPVIRYKGLKDSDGLWMLPIGPNQFFVAFNRGEIDMQGWISHSISDGHFIESMNKYVVQHAIKYVYGIDDTQVDFVERYLPTEPLPLEQFL